METVTGLRDYVKTNNGDIFHVTVVVYSDHGSIDHYVTDDWGYPAKYSDYPTKLVQDKVKELTKLLTGS